MSIPRLAADPSTELRPSVRIATLAEAWECDISQIRRLIDDGALEAHGVGKRAVRVYIDSANAYQAHKMIASKSPRSDAQRRAQAAGRAAGKTRHKEAMAYLRRLRLV